jgi:hypothetical protein
MTQVCRTTFFKARKFASQLSNRCQSAMAPSQKLVNLLSVMCESLLVGKLAHLSLNY